MVVAFTVVTVEPELRLPSVAPLVIEMVTGVLKTGAPVLDSNVTLIVD